MCWRMLLVLLRRLHRSDYHRSAFGHLWDDNNDASLGHNGCDTSDEILTRDLVDKAFVWIKRCPNAVATGTLHDPYTNQAIAFQRGRKGQRISADRPHCPARLWLDMGAYSWPDRQWLRFANDLANLLAVDGQANPEKERFATGLVDVVERRVYVPNTPCSSSRCYAGYQLPVDEGVDERTTCKL